MTSDMDTVLDVVPFNTHTLKCTVSFEFSVTDVNGTLMFSFIKEGVLLYIENKSISHPGTFTTVNTMSEHVEGMSHHICNVTLFIHEILIESSMDATIVQVLGK